MLSRRILEHVAHLPEGTPVGAKALGHLGSRSSINLALSRLAKEGELSRPGSGIYVRPIRTRFGSRAPLQEKFVEQLAKVSGETIAPHGAAAANRLGLTSQVPLNVTWLTTGRSRRYRLGALTVHLRHAPPWQLRNVGTVSNEVVRALAWAGSKRARTAVRQIKSQLDGTARAELLQARGSLPRWLSTVISIELASDAHRDSR